MAGQRNRNHVNLADHEMQFEKDTNYTNCHERLKAGVDCWIIPCDSCNSCLISLFFASFLDFFLRNTMGLDHLARILLIAGDHLNRKLFHFDFVVYLLK